MSTQKKLSPLFDDVVFYLTVVPSYVGGFMALGWATNNINLRKSSIAKLQPRFKNFEFKTKYYNPEVHVASFTLPTFLKSESL